MAAVDAKVGGSMLAEETVSTGGGDDCVGCVGLLVVATDWNSFTSCSPSRTVRWRLLARDLTKSGIRGSFCCIKV